MTRDARIEQRLSEWGAWFSAGGCGGDGFPGKNILHPSWLPPVGGTPHTLTAVHASSDRRERETHDAIGALSDKLIVVIVGRYSKRMTAAQQAIALRVSSSAIEARLDRARQRLVSMLPV